VTDRPVRVSAVIPTLGASPYLAACLRALRADGVDEIVVVAQGVEEQAAERDEPRAKDLAALRPLADVWLDLPPGGGFTVATNRGIEVATGEYLATVNDDAVVQNGWRTALIAALEANPTVAAVQGVNLRMVGSAPASTGEDQAGAAAGDKGPGEVDGWGLGWNRWWQAVQLGHGEPPPPVDAPPRPVFGVSATAALYRREALDQVGLFDERLISWYEDADLAVRLRAAGWEALSVPAARAHHAGGTTAARLPRKYATLLYANRWLVVARLRGHRFPLALPRLFLRDLADLVRSAVSPLTLLQAWLRALGLLPRFAHPRYALKSMADR